MPDPGGGGRDASAAAGAPRHLDGGEIGRGGMGAVHRVHDTRLGRDVAVKPLLTRSSSRLPSSPRAWARTPGWGRWCGRWPTDSASWTRARHLDKAFGDGDGATTGREGSAIRYSTTSCSGRGPSWLPEPIFTVSGGGPPRKVR